MPQDRGGDIETVQVVGDEDQPAAPVVEHEHARVDVLLGALRHPAVDHHAGGVVGDHALRHAGRHRLLRRGAGQTQRGDEHAQSDQTLHCGCHVKSSATGLA